MRKTICLLIGILAVVVLAGGGQLPAAAQAPGLSPLEALGKAIFFDTNLSLPPGQSCASCHGPEVGWTGPDSQVNATTGGIYPGAVPNRFGNRKPPASAYAGEAPVLYYDETEEGWFGGLFWDGRATGWTLGDPLAEQAQGPFLNPLEQAMPNARTVCVAVARSAYAGLFRQVWGAGSLDCAKDAAGAYERIARAVAAYERSAEVNPLSSKFDAFWDAALAAGKDVTKIRWGGGMNNPNRWQAFRGLGLSDTELRGLAAFVDPNRADCASCHSLEPGDAGYPLFTDYGYDNLGIPRNPDNPFYSMPPAWNPDGAAWVDPGLGGFLKAAGYGPEVYEPEIGNHRVPTLRNVDLRPSADFVKAYGHNGYFRSLEDIVLFYAWRGMMSGGGMGDCDGGGMGGGGGMCGVTFPDPEVAENLTPMKHFGMMDQANIVAFLKTLSDGYYTRAASSPVASTSVDPGDGGGLGEGVYIPLVQTGE